MKRNKILLLTGKCLFALGMLYPLPLCYVPYLIFFNFLNMPGVADVSNGYWWPLLIVMALGWILCVIACKKTIGSKLPSTLFQDTPIVLYFSIVKWAFIIAVGILLVISSIIGIYWLFRELPGLGFTLLIGGAFVVQFIRFGVYFFTKNKKK